MRRSFTPACALLLLANLSTSSVHASHVRGGEVHYTHLTGYTYQIEVHLYVDLQTQGPLLYIDAGDATGDTLSLTQVDTLTSYCTAYRTIYSGVHTYAGPGLYAIRAQVMSRSADVLSIQDPAFEPLCVQADLYLSPLTGNNSSSTFATMQTDVYYSGGVLLHELQPSDPDGDSLSFELISPAGTNCVWIYPYYLPQDIGPAADTSWVDANGVFHWDHPTILGTFIVAIRCTEWRNGFQVGRVTRDMVLCVNATTAVGEQAVVEGLQVLPTLDRGVVDVWSEYPTGSRLEILDQGGRLVANTAISGTHTRVDLGAVSPGMYMARVATNDAALQSARFVLPQ